MSEPPLAQDAHRQPAVQDGDERFRSAFDAAATGFAIVGLDGRIREVNRSLSEMLGYGKDELLATTFDAITHPDDVPPSAVLGARLLAGEIDCFHLEKRYFHRQGHLVWAALTVSIVRAAGGAPVHFIAQVTDTSARKAAEEALAQRAAKLERSNAELEQFAYVASHDLREPLRQVASYAQLLAERYRDRPDERAARWIGYVLGGVERMQLLIDDLLALARVQTHGGAFAATDPATVVNRVWGTLRLKNGGIEATLTCDPLPMVLVDAVQFEQLFQNLLGNAVKYRRQDVGLLVHVSAEWHGENVGSEWEFSVRDNGTGLDMANAERIFEIFERLPREDRDTGEAEGTGIGLAICKKILQRHGGRIWVTSVPGAGATFSFTLPEWVR